MKTLEQNSISKLSLLFKALYDLQPKIDYVGLSIINQLIKPLGNLPDMSSVYDALGGSISRFANTLSGYNDIVANLYSSPLIDFYKNLPNYNDMLLNGFGVNTTPLIEDDIENDDGENDDDEKEQKNTQE